MEEFISYARLIIGALGYKVFEPLIAKKQTEEAVATTETEDKPLLYFSSSKVEATGKRTSEGFVVMVGSHVSLTFTKSVPESVIKNREKYAAAITADGVLAKDLLFTSPSAAAGFVGGMSLSGNVVWKTEDGKTLKQLESEE